MRPTNRSFKQHTGVFLNLTDLVCVTVSFILSYKLIASIHPTTIEIANFWQVLITFLSVQIFTFWILDFYRDSLQEIGIENALKITAIVMYAIMLTAAALLAVKIFPFDSGIQLLVLDFYFLLTFLMGSRLVYQSISYRFPQKKSKAKVLIYGADKNGALILERIKNTSHNTFEVLGFLDNNPDTEGTLIHGYPIYSTHTKLPQKLQNVEIDYIFACEQDLKPGNFKRLKKLAEANGIEIKCLKQNLKSILTDSQDKDSISVQINEARIPYILFTALSIHYLKNLTLKGFKDF